MVGSVWTKIVYSPSFAPREPMDQSGPMALHTAGRISGGAPCTLFHDLTIGDSDPDEDSDHSRRQNIHWHRYRMWYAAARRRRTICAADQDAAGTGTAHASSSWPATGSGTARANAARPAFPELLAVDSSNDIARSGSLAESYWRACAGTTSTHGVSKGTAAANADAVGFGTAGTNVRSDPIPVSLRPCTEDFDATKEQDEFNIAIENIFMTIKTLDDQDSARRAEHQVACI